MVRKRSEDPAVAYLPAACFRSLPSRDLTEPKPGQTLMCPVQRQVRLCDMRRIANLTLKARLEGLRGFPDGRPGAELESGMVGISVLA